MEFVNHGSCGKLDAESKQKIRAAAMRIYRQRQRQSRTVSVTVLKTKSAARKGTANEGERMDVKALEPKRLGLCVTELHEPVVGQRPTTWTKESWSSRLMNLVYGLADSYYGYLDEQAGEGASHGLSFAWSEAPSPMLLSGMALACCGTMMALDEKLPPDIAYRYKGIILKELGMRANSPVAFFSGPVMLALLSLCSYELSVMSDEACLHLQALRRTLDARGGVEKGALTHCHHFYLQVDISDIVLATWTDRTPVLSDLDGGVCSSRRLAYHMNAVMAAMTAEVYGMNDEDYGVYRSLHDLPYLLLQLQQYFDGMTAGGTLKEQGSCRKHLEDFRLRAYGSSESDGDSDDTQLVAKTVYLCLSVVLELSVDDGFLQGSGRHVYVQGLPDCISRISDETWKPLPCLTFFVFLVAGLILQETRKQSRCEAMLLKTLHVAAPTTWLRLRSFTTNFYHIVRVFRGQSTGISSSATTGYGHARSALFPVPDMTHHPKLRARMQADQKFFEAGDREGHWRALNEKLAPLLLTG